MILATPSGVNVQRQSADFRHKYSGCNSDNYQNSLTNMDQLKNTVITCIKNNDIDKLRDTLKNVKEKLTHKYSDLTEKQRKFLEFINQPVDEENNTFLHVAAANGNLYIIKELVFNAADRFAKNIHHAVPFGFSKNNNMEVDFFLSPVISLKNLKTICLE
tara:strand:+ start:656 stop:1135 length:480 start_codon:yes stop_codon:yes gene_type:complete